MEKPTIQEIHKVMKENNMKVFTAPFDVTLGAIRTKDNESGKFNDWIFASMPTEDGGIMAVVMPGTTDAGLYYRLNPINPKGTAVIQHGKQYRGVYQYQNPKKNKKQRGHKGQEAFKQIGNMDYWRDNDKDKYLEFDGPEENTNNATNGHDMGTRGEDVGKWSAGCWGSTEGNMEVLYLMAKKQIEAGIGDKFSFALLHEDMF